MTCENCNTRPGKMEQTPAGPRTLCNRCRTASPTKYRRAWQGRRARRLVLADRKFHRERVRA